MTSRQAVLDLSLDPLTMCP